MKEQKNKSRKCLSCDIEMLRIEGIYALTKVEKVGEGLTFFPASGVPVIVFVCPNCGEIKIFSAKLAGEI